MPYPRLLEGAVSNWETTSSIGRGTAADRESGSPSKTRLKMFLSSFGTFYLFKKSRLK